MGKEHLSSRRKSLRASTLLREATPTRSNTSVSSSSTVLTTLITPNQMELLLNTSSLRSHTDQALPSERLESLFKRILRAPITSKLLLLPTELSSLHQPNLTQ